MKTTQELIEIIVQNNLLQPLFDDELEELDLEDVNIKQAMDSLGNIEWKDSRADTSEFWTVIYLKNHDVYLKIEGEYDSYMEYNHDYNTVTQVFPKEVTQTIYE